MRRTAVLAGLASLCVVSLLSACGSGSAGSGADSGGDKAPVTLMTINAVGTPIQNYPDIPAGAQAAADAINAKGGINGHKVVIEACNTQADTNKAVACARKAASDKVAAVVSQQDLFSPQILPILEQAGIPSVGLISSGNAVDLISPASYPIGGGQGASYVGLPFGLKAKGISKIAVAAADAAAAKTNTENVKRGAQSAGVEFAGSVGIPLTGVTDYAPFAQQLKNLDAPAVVLLTSPAQTQGLLKAAKDLGMTIQWAHNAFSFGETEAASVGPAAEGLMVAGNYPAAGDASNPAIKEFLDEMKAAGKAEAINLRTAGVNAWLSVYAVQAVGSTIKGDITAQTMTEALKTLPPTDLKGLATFDPSKGGPAPFNRVGSSMTYFSQIKDGRLVGAGIPPVDVITKL